MVATILNMTARNGLNKDTPTFQFNDLNFVQLRYTDIMGKILAKYMVSYTDDPLEDLQNGIALDGSSVRGFSEINESDLLLFPDKSTLRLMPHYNFKVATVIADVYQGFGNGRLIRDPRYVSQLLEE